MNETIYEVELNGTNNQKLDVDGTSMEFSFDPLSGLYTRQSDRRYGEFKPGFQVGSIKSGNTVQSSTYSSSGIS